MFAYMRVHMAQNTNIASLFLNFFELVEMVNFPPLKRRLRKDEIRTLLSTSTYSYLLPLELLMQDNIASL